MEARDCDEALRQVLPDFAFDRATAVPEQGWDFWTFRVDGEWIFRFPRHDEAARAIEREFVVLPVIAPRLPVAVPRYDWKGTWAGLPFGGYRLIRGEPYEPGAFTVPTIATALGEVLHALHGIPVELAAAKLEEDSSGAGWIDSQRRFLVKARDAIPLLEPGLVAHLDMLIAAYLELAASGWPPALVHNDLGPVHVIGRSDQVAGLIDWSDMTIGDPAVDFAGILARSGQSAFRAVEKAYGRPGGPAFARRVRYYACVAPLHDVLHGIATGDAAILRDGIEGFARRQALLD